MGEVYRATDTKLGRDVTISPSVSGDAFRAASPRTLMELPENQRAHRIFEIAPGTGSTSLPRPDKVISSYRQRLGSSFAV